ncbi:hypothetical protein NQZ68_030916 [Dissostichus eleginoides]|nr:hypothetical protein NQZ68_030916 [Dissostichus eleginoides]
MDVKIQSIPNKLHHSPAGLSSPLISPLSSSSGMAPPLPLAVVPILARFSSLGNKAMEVLAERDETGRQRDNSYARNAGACCEDNKVRRTSAGAQPAHLPGGVPESRGPVALTAID